MKSFPQQSTHQTIHTTVIIDQVFNINPNDTLKSKFSYSLPHQSIHKTSHFREGIVTVYHINPYTTHHHHFFWLLCANLFLEQPRQPWLCKFVPSQNFLSKSIAHQSYQFLLLFFVILAKPS